MVNKGQSERQKRKLDDRQDDMYTLIVSIQLSKPILDQRLTTPASKVRLVKETQQCTASRRLIDNPQLRHLMLSSVPLIESPDLCLGTKVKH